MAVHPFRHYFLSLLQVLPVMLWYLPLLFSTGIPSTFAAQLQPSHQPNLYFNPILPGWHPDPSCIQNRGLFFCVTSTFQAFPGLPVYISANLIEWKLASHAWNRDSQLPGLSWNTTGQANGMYAPTIRYRNGVYYVIVAYVRGDSRLGLLFKTTDPFDNASWEVPISIDLKDIDPDLFWDDDGKAYVATAGVSLQELDLESGSLGEAIPIWNGTGGAWPEGPHLYKKDGWYYLLIAEGGTSEKHSITIARAKTIQGPYTSNPSNPILTNRGTDEYFQSVGHGDLFQDAAGNWWGFCLAIRSGPAYAFMPMGREAVLFNATWSEEGWPVLQPVRGRMAGNSLPSSPLTVLGNGPAVDGNDRITFRDGVPVPPHFIHHRVPPPGTFVATKNGLYIQARRANLTGDQMSSDVELTGQHGLSFIGRRQSHTLFRFAVDLALRLRTDGQEAGISIFRSQNEHIDLSIIRRLNQTSNSSCGDLLFRLSGISPSTTIEERLVSVPKAWKNQPIRFEVEAYNASDYTFSVSQLDNARARIVIGKISSGAVSGRGGIGFFLGSMVGAFATCNGRGSGNKCKEGSEVFIQRWVYEGIGQEIANGEVIPTKD
ncbi:unnamed protein product [Clonostachys byssicola]|uniref:Beta-xylosidase C-terminal Concanavalin A-like domain-containing protein n=1 Tax=Clonostachys byssicola TaxID=160290 RepID=A0A9N9UYD9_9HYPO|nr:unnamed protein product [Clonostachys byssicola]